MVTQPVAPGVLEQLLACTASHISTVPRPGFVGRMDLYWSIQQNRCCTAGGALHCEAWLNELILTNCCLRDEANRPVRNVHGAKRAFGLQAPAPCPPMLRILRGQHTHESSSVRLPQSHLASLIRRTISKHL